MKTGMRLSLIVALGFAGVVFHAENQKQPVGSVSSSVDDWPSYGHDAGGMRYSPLTQE
jgi:glucose dehydrogenase